MDPVRFATVFAFVGLLPTAARAATAVTEDAPKLEAQQGLLVTGFLQGQYEHHQDSQDELRQGGQLLNLDRFLLRRGRIKFEREYTWTSYILELDGNTVNGPALGVQRAEASFQIRGGNQGVTPPIFKLTFGVFDTPFGYENTESSRFRWFAERSTAMRAFQPSEVDAGLRITGAIGWFRYAFAIVNGEPLGQSGGFPLRDPNAAKDYVLRLSGVGTPSKETQVDFGVSIMNGKGFHRGADSSKPLTVWRDLNENGVVDAGEIQGLPSGAGEASESFERWMVGADLKIRFQTPIGVTQLWTEATIASNMDRGLYVADRVALGIDARELGYYVGIQQEVPLAGGTLVLAFRTDYYNPNADVFDRQGGKLLPNDITVRTFSPLVGYAFPGKGRVVLQYDKIRDHYARDGRGVPTDLANDTWTLRMQVDL